MLKIHEVTGVDGELAGIYLRLAGDGREGLELVEQSGVMAVPEGALEIVMKRYGAPYDDQARVTAVAELELGAGCKLRHVRHLAGYDVVQRDYLVLERPGDESLCAPGTTVAGALQHLARAAARSG